MLIQIRLLNRRVCHKKMDFLIKWIIIRSSEYGPSKHNEKRLIVREGIQDFIAQGFKVTKTIRESPRLGFLEEANEHCGNK